jgi:hypothetical protein
MLTTHPLLVQRLRKSRSYTSSSLKRFSWRVVFVFTIIYNNKYLFVSEPKPATVSGMCVFMKGTFGWRVGIHLVNRIFAYAFRVQCYNGETMMMMMMMMMIMIIHDPEIFKSNSQNIPP